MAINPRDILNDPAGSDWIKNALKAALMRDPVDAANDAEVLAKVLSDHADAVFAAAVGRVGLPRPMPDLNGQFSAEQIKAAVKQARASSQAQYPGGGMCMHCQSKIDEAGLCRCDIEEQLNTP